MAAHAELGAWLGRIEALQRMHWGQCTEMPTMLADWLYLGGNLDGDENWQRWLEGEGRDVTHIVNCVAAEVNYPVPAKVQMLRLRAEDDATYDLFAHWPAVKDFVEDAKRTGKAVLFHCQAGVNRSAALAVAAYAVRESKPLLASVQVALAQRPGILKNWNFIRQLVRCLQDEGLMDSEGHLEVLNQELAAYEQKVHAVFDVISKDGFTDWARFQEALREASEDNDAVAAHWERMQRYSDRPMPSCHRRNEASVELWFRFDALAQELFPRLLRLATAR